MHNKNASKTKRHVLNKKSQNCKFKGKGCSEPRKLSIFWASARSEIGESGRFFQGKKTN